MKKLSLLISLLLFVAFGGACHSANSGMYSVETSWGKVTQVHPPGDYYTTFSPGAAAHDVDGKPWVIDVEVHTATKDNAALKIPVRVQGMVNPNTVAEFFAKFGDDQKVREQKINEFITSAVQPAGRDAVVQHDAYSVFAEQDAIQSVMAEKVKAYMEQQMFCQFISVQIIGKPVFDNADIENAAGKVVAAQKLKQAAEQQKLAAQTTLEKNQIENQIYSQSPQAFELAKLALQRDIAEKWAAHPGALVFGGSNLQVQIPSNK